MGLLDELLAQVASGNAPAMEVDNAYDQVSRSVPKGALADGLTHAFNSDKTPPFDQMLGALFGQSNPDQKAALINQIVAAVGPAILTQVLGKLGGSGSPGGSADAVTAGQLTPAQAQNIPLERVEVLAKEAARENPSIVEMAAGFFAEHPTLIKTLGASALAVLMSNISSARTQ